MTCLSMLVVLGLTAAACGGDDGKSKPDAGGKKNSDGANSASFRGVTADTIKVGVAVPDFAALRKAGIPTFYGDYKLVYQSFFDAINKAGGIHGRKIESHYADFSYIDAASQDAACSKLTEDDKVFIVLGGLLSTSNLCFTELHKTMVMTGIFLTEELKKRSGDTLWLSTQPIEGAIIQTLGQAVAKAGLLKGKKIGIVALGAADEGAAGKTMQRVLKERGFDSTVAVTSAPTDDRTAVDAEMASITQRFKADDIDVVFSLTEGPGIYEPFAAANYHPLIIDRSLGSSVVASNKTAILDGVLGIGPRPGQDVWDDAEFTKNCSDIVLKDHPELKSDFAKQVPDGEEQKAGLASWYITIAGACEHTSLLEKLGEIAGADLTNDTFRAALDKLGTVPFHGVGQASYRSKDKWDGLDTFYLQRWSEAKKSLVTEGGPIVLKR